MLNVYGIKNCDTMKKAFRWLEDNQIDYQFHDYKKVGVKAEQAKTWIDKLGWENVINKRGTTWRKLDDTTKETMDAEKAVELIQQQPSIIKRPLIETATEMYLGFNAEQYAQAFH